MSTKHERSAYGKIRTALLSIESELILSTSNVIKISFSDLNKDSEEGEKLYLLLSRKEKIIKAVDWRELAFAYVDKTGKRKIKMEVFIKKFNRYKSKNCKIYKKLASEYQNSLEEESSRQASKKINSLELSPNTKWEDISIRFIDGHNIEIAIGKIKYKRDYKDLGFQDERKLKPNKQWRLLEFLSKNSGWLTPDTLKFSEYSKKNKQLLSDSLKKSFQIKDDPFYRYNKKDGYRIKLSFVDKITDKLQESRSEDSLGIKDSFEELTQNK